MGDRSRGRYLYHAKDVCHGDYLCKESQSKCESFKCKKWVSRWVENDSGCKKVEYGFCSINALKSLGVDDEE